MKTWKMAGASQLEKRQSQNRIDRLKEIVKGSCVATCENKQWLVMAEDLLRNNKVNKFVFAECVHDLLQNGKNRNLLITGPANCGKKFILNSLALILDTFANTSTAKYAFVGGDVPQ